MSADTLDSFGGRRALVTGGAGVIGRELVALLQRHGARIRVVDREPRPPEFDASIDYLQCDVNDLRAADLHDFAPELLFHLAASFERSVETREFWDENDWDNVRASHHLMGLADTVPELSRVVFASSYLLYDPALYCFDAPRQIPERLSEQSPISPRNICGGAKLLHELELRFLTGFPAASYSSVSARIFRVYGKGSRDIVSRWVRGLIAAPEESLTVFRKEGIFDYVYAGDVAEGLARLALAPATGCVNLGSGRGRSVVELLDILRRHFPALEIREEASEIPYEAHEADLARLEAVTGWTPSTALEEGVAALVAYERAARAPKQRIGRNAGSVLVTSASSKIPLLDAFRAAQRGRGGRVIAGDADPECVARYFADEFWQMPRLDALSIEALIARCEALGVDLIVPTRDAELPWFAGAREALESAGITVPIGSESGVALCLDKLRFAEHCRELGLPAIPTFAQRPEGDGPWVVKERFGAGSRAIGLGLSAPQADAHAGTLENAVFQPLCAGVEYSVDLYVSRGGALLGAVPRKRVRVQHGESTVTETVDAPALVELADALAKGFGLRGHAVFQAFVAETGEISLIECNARVGGASALAFAVGLDSPGWMLREARGETLRAARFEPRPGLRLVRRAVDRIVPP